MNAVKKLCLTSLFFFSTALPQGLESLPINNSLDQANNAQKFYATAMVNAKQMDMLEVMKITQELSQFVQDLANKGLSSDQIFEKIKAEYGITVSANVQQTVAALEKKPSYKPIIIAILIASNVGIACGYFGFFAYLFSIIHP